MPEISIIVPIYKVECYLEKALDSLINQTYKNIEIICVDDCSPDNSSEIVKKYLEKDSRVKLIKNKKNLGLSGARNVGLKIAISPYIMFLDPDDWYDLDACEVLYNEILRKNVDLAIFGTRMVFPNKIKEYPKGLFYLEKSMLRENSTKLLYDLNWSVWNKIWKKSILNKYEITYPEKQNFEDAPFYFKYMAFVKNVSILKPPKYNYLQRPNSIVAQLRYKKIEDLMYYVLAVENVFLFYKKHSIIENKGINLLIIADRFIRDAINVAGLNKDLLKAIVEKSSQILKKIDIDISINDCTKIDYNFITALKNNDVNYFYQLNRVQTKVKLRGIIKEKKVNSEDDNYVKKIYFFGIKILEKVKAKDFKKISFLGILINNKNI